MLWMAVPAGTAGSERLARESARRELYPVRLSVLAGDDPQGVEALVPDLGRGQGADTWAGSASRTTIHLYSAA